MKAAARHGEEAAGEGMARSGIHATKEETTPLERKVVAAPVSEGGRGRQHGRR
jgi:hypothetical protein